MVAKTLELPNVKRLFRPDPGHIIFDIDLDRADAQVVAWEANDEPLKKAFREGLDIHLQNAADIFGLPVTEADLRDEQRADALAKQYDKERQNAKQGVHGTNYGASANTIAKTLRIPLAAAEHFQQLWFDAHPGVLEWHDRVENDLQTTREIYNAFGYRRHYFDRPDRLLSEGLAWIPQSTVALVINKGIVNIDRKLKGHVDILLQVHDSLVGQCKIADFKHLLPEIKDCVTVEIPYDDPLVIGVGIEASTKSWGDCKTYVWETGEPKQ